MARLIVGRTPRESEPCFWTSYQSRRKVLEIVLHMESIKAESWPFSFPAFRAKHRSRLHSPLTYQKWLPSLLVIWSFPCVLRILSHNLLTFWPQRGKDKQQRLKETCNLRERHLLMFSAYSLHINLFKRIHVAPRLYEAVCLSMFLLCVHCTLSHVQKNPCSPQAVQNCLSVHVPLCVCRTLLVPNPWCLHQWQHPVLEVKAAE